VFTRQERLAKLARTRLYAITGESGDQAQTLRRAEAILRGGADVLQLRRKHSPAGHLVELASRLRDLTDQYGALLIINDYPELALASAADGVHLGQDDLPVSVVRRLAGAENLVLGLSTHSLDQARAGSNAGADYIGVGPVFATPTKPGREQVGLGLVREVAAVVSLPFVAIGGIDRARAPQVIAAGARALALVRALWDDPDPESAARQIRLLLDSALGAAA
jgi:thiamine-phosphate pyrophosphorylase